MEQKVNSKQLKEIYFNTPSPTRSFHEPSRYDKMKEPNHSFSKSKNHYQRYSEDEISHFEKFFNKQDYHANLENDVPASKNQDKVDFLDEFETLVTDRCLEKDFNPNTEATNTKTFTTHAKAVAIMDGTVASNNNIEKESQISQLEKDLINQASSNVDVKIESFNLEETRSSTLFELNNDEISVTEEAEAERIDLTHFEETERIDLTPSEDVEYELDDDLIYLDTLVSNGGNGVNATPLDSIGNLLDEIIDNEKNPTSNYQTDVFNANMQLLFDVDPEADLPSMSEDVDHEDFANPPLEVDEKTTEMEIESSSEIENVDHKETVSESLKLGEKIADAKIESIDDIEHVEHESSEQKAHDDFLDFIPEQSSSKKSKLHVLDTILVILLLIIVGFLLVYFRELLPFDLPFDLPF